MKSQPILLIQLKVEEMVRAKHRLIERRKRTSLFMEKDLKANCSGSHQTHLVVALKLDFNVTIRSLSLSFSLFQNIQSCFSLILTLRTILLTQTHTHT